jgi:hypothetical protein
MTTSVAPIAKRTIAGMAATTLIALACLALPASPAAAAPSRASAPPADFHAQSESWLSPQDGWLLGSAPCDGDTCTTVIGTTNGGGKWNTLGTLTAPLTIEDKTGVTELRFADDMHGWAFEPALWATNDGGATWKKQKLPGGGHLVLGLAADADAAYMIVSPCTFNDGNCTDPAVLWKSKPGHAWKKVTSVTLPAFFGFGIASLAVHGTTAYVGVPAFLTQDDAQAPMDVLYATVDGTQWQTRTDPCDPSNGETLAGIAAISDTKVALLCQANIGFGKAAKRVLRSSDNAQTTKSAGTMPQLGITSAIAAAPNGTLAVSSYSIGSWIYLNQGGKHWTTSEDLGDGGQGWNDITFVSNSVGYVIHGPASCCGGQGPGGLWETQDGGVNWAPA